MQGDPAGVDAEVVGVVDAPSEGSYNVVERRWAGVSRREAVLHGHHDYAEPDGQGRVARLVHRGSPPVNPPGCTSRMPTGAARCSGRNTCRATAGKPSPVARALKIGHASDGGDSGGWLLLHRGPPCCKLGVEGEGQGVTYRRPA